MKNRASTFQVYRKDCFLNGKKHGFMIGVIRANVKRCEEGLPAPKGATHILTERLFTLVRPGDVLVGGLEKYDVVGVEEFGERGFYSVIYARRREACA